MMAAGTREFSSLLRTMGWRFFSRMFRSQGAGTDKEGVDEGSRDG